MRPRDWGLALLVVIGWGLNFVVIRFALEELPPLLLGALRFLVLAFPAILFIKPPPIAPRLLLAYGLLISFGQFALLFLAMHFGMPAGLASLVLQSQMLFTLTFAAVFLGEQWRWHQLVAMLIAGSGLFLLASQTAATQMTLLGFVLTIGAASCWGAGNIINRIIAQKPGVPVMSLIVWGSLVPVLPFLICSLLFEGPAAIGHSLAAAGWQSVWTIAYLALISTLFGYGSWNYLMRHYPASVVAPLSLLVPVVGLFSAWFILGETLNLMQGLGILLILAGLAFNVFGPRLSRARGRRL
ncbi:EamA family transporter [Granulosicoccaceae sp. 1_MG-2023]|nr:EamA family transporter [Granulosicoccaceae sp. 1_MG-2023]